MEYLFLFLLVKYLYPILWNAQNCLHKKLRAVMGVVAGINQT